MLNKLWSQRKPPGFLIPITCLIFLTMLASFLSIRNFQVLISPHYFSTFLNTSFSIKEFNKYTARTKPITEHYRTRNYLFPSSTSHSQSKSDFKEEVSSSKSTYWRDAAEISLLPKHQKLDERLIAYLKNQTVIISACCRNLIPYLSKFRRNINAITSAFKGYRLIFGESDSTDATLTYLKNWSLSDLNVTVHTFGKLANNSNYYEQRTSRLSYCRNFLLNNARNDHHLEQARFYLVVDPDVNANDIFTMDNFFSNFEYDWDSWAVMTAAQTAGYYDIWALRSRWMPYDCWRMVARHKELNMTWSEAAATFVWQQMSRAIPKDHGLIEVNSAFGGFAIYQTKYLNNCSYHGQEDGFDICEHVPFHRCIKANSGRLFINPKFQNAANRVKRK